MSGPRARQLLKQWTFRLLCTRWVNFFLTRLVKPFAGLLPRSARDRLPFVGQLKIPVAGSRAMVLETDGTDWIASRLFWSGQESFEPETRAVFLSLLRSSRVFFDVGANTGLYTLLAALSPGERQVHAFEAVPRTYARLERNLAMNRASNAVAVCGAAGDRDGEINLYIPGGPYLPISASTRRNFRRAEEVITVPAMRLDGYREREGIQAVDLLKIDTESTEPEVLEGARGILRTDQPIIICEVLAGLTEDALNALFADTNYRFFHITAEGLSQAKWIRGDETYRWMNYLFVTPRRLAIVKPWVR